MAIESLRAYIEDQLRRDDLTEVERTFLSQEGARTNAVLLIPEVKTKQKSENVLEEAAKLGKRLYDVYVKSTPGETPDEELCEVLLYTPGKINALRAGSSALVDFALSLTTAEKSLISRSLGSVEKELSYNRGNSKPTIADYKEFDYIVHDGFRPRALGKAQTAFLQAAFPKPSTQPH